MQSSIYGASYKSRPKEKLLHMDGSITTMTSIHLFIAGTLFGVLLLWIFLFAFLALRPEAKKKTAEPSYNTSNTSQSQPTVTKSLAVVQPTSSPLHPHIYEETNKVEVAHLV